MFLKHKTMTNHEDVEELKDFLGPLREQPFVEEIDYSEIETEEVSVRHKLAKNMVVCVISK